MIKNILRSLAASIVAVAALAAPIYATSGNGTASLSLSPSAGSYQVGNTFTVTVRETSSGPVAGVQADFHYDSSKLQCLGVDASGSAFAQQYQNSCGGGMVNIARTVQGTTVTGTQKIASVSFKVLAGSGSTALTAAGSSEILDDSVNNVCNSSCAEGTTLASFSFSTPAPAPTPTPTPAPTPQPGATQPQTNNKSVSPQASQAASQSDSDGVVAAVQATAEPADQDSTQQQSTASEPAPTKPSAVITWALPVAAVVAVAATAAVLRQKTAKKAAGAVATKKPVAKKATRKTTQVSKSKKAKKS